MLLPLTQIHVLENRRFVDAYCRTPCMHTATVYMYGFNAKEAEWREEGGTNERRRKTQEITRAGAVTQPASPFGPPFFSFIP